MKLLLGLLASTALAAALPQFYFYQMGTCPSGGQCSAAQACSGNSCTGTNPTTSATQGLGLGGVGGYRLTVCAASGQTLSGAGTLQAWGFSSAEGVWVRNAALDQSVTATTRCQSFPDFVVAYSFDRVQFVASAVTVSLGDATHGLDVMLEGARAGNGR